MVVTSAFMLAVLMIVGAAAVAGVVIIRTRIVGVMCICIIMRYSYDYELCYLCY